MNTVQLTTPEAQLTTMVSGLRAVFWTQVSQVAAACSGIRSLTALLALTTVYSFMVFKSPWKRVAMIASAFPLAIFGNVMRLCFTIAVAEVGGQAAGKAVETDAGFVTFIVAIVGIYFLGRWLERPETPKPEAAT